MLFRSVLTAHAKYPRGNFSRQPYSNPAFQAYTPTKKFLWEVDYPVGESAVSCPICFTSLIGPLTFNRHSNQLYALRECNDRQATICGSVAAPLASSFHALRPLPCFPLV